MPFTYTANVPQATQTIAQTQPTILQNFGYLNDFGSKNHNFSGDSANANDGHHTNVRFIPQSTPVAEVGLMQLYSRIVGGDTQLFAQTGGGGRSQLTGYSALQNGYQYIGGMVVQWGMQALPGPGSQLVSFPSATAFVSSPYVVLPVLIESSTSIHAGQAYVSIVDASITTTQFKYNYKITTLADFTGFYWIAIGPGTT